MSSFLGHVYEQLLTEELQRHADMDCRATTARTTEFGTGHCGEQSGFRIFSSSKSQELCLLYHGCTALSFQVAASAGENFAKNADAIFLETSAKDDINVHTLFKAIGKVSSS